MGAAFGDGLNGTGGEGEGDGLLQFRDINALFLEIDILSDVSGRVELGSTSPVGVTSTYPRTLL